MNAKFLAVDVLVVLLLETASCPASDPDRIDPPAIEAPSLPNQAGSREQSPAAGIRKPRFTPILPPSGGGSQKDDSKAIVPDLGTFDFGSVIKGDVIHLSIPIKNEGEWALEVWMGPRPTYPTVIPPGEKGTFEMKVESSRLGTGKVTKHADISTSDPKRARMQLTLTGMVESFFKIEPEGPRITHGERRKPIEIILVKDNQAEIRIVGAKSRNGRLDVVVEEILPGVKWKLLVTENPDPKDLQDHLTDEIEVDVRIGDRLVTQTIGYITVKCEDRIEISPRMVYFRRTDLQGLRENGTPAAKTVDVKATRGPPYRFLIKEVKFNDVDSPFKADIMPVQDGREYRLVVHIDKMPDLLMYPNQKSLKANLTIVTDEEGKLSEISIRVVAFF